MKLQSLALSVGIIGTLVLSGCGGSKGTTTGQGDESVSEVVEGNVGGIANGTEANGTMNAQYFFTPTQTLWAKIRMGVTPISEAVADGGLCPVARSMSCSASGEIVLNYDDCKRGGATWDGGEVLQFSSEAVCMARTSGPGVPTSGSLLRTFAGTLANDPTIEIVGDRQTALDSTTPSGYSQSLSGGTEVAFSSSNGNPMRSVTINGINLVNSESANGNVHWNHTLSTISPLVIQGYGSNKQISSGETMLQHNLAKYIAQTSIQSTLTFSADCCHPTGGSLETVFSGSKTGTEIISFSSTCGQATLTAADGSQASIQLRHCW